MVTVVVGGEHWPWCPRCRQSAGRPGGGGELAGPRTDGARAADDALRHLLAVATQAVASRDRDALGRAACQHALAALGAAWAAVGYVDQDGAAVASDIAVGIPPGTVVAEPAAVAASRVAARSDAVRLPRTTREQAWSVDAARVDGDQPGGAYLLVGRVGSSSLDGDFGDDGPPAADAAFLEQLAALVGAAFAHLRQDAEVDLSAARLAEAQQVARLGSYDWTIATDTNVWSDELYRIYGYEPGAFHPTYDRFLSLVHPDDRERIVGVHTRALEDHQPYRMDERIVRPDGEVRILDSNGKVVLDEWGRPARMVGVCLDVTEQRRAAEALHRSEERFRDLVESSPDAVLLVDGEGTVVQANQRTATLFGWAPDDLVGRPASLLLPPEVLGARTSTVAAEGRRRDGTTVPVDVSLAAIRTEDGEATAAFVRDATERQRIAAADRRFARAEERRRQAVELNDNVVQHLTAVVCSLEMGMQDEALRASQATLASARSMMGELLDGMPEQLVPGDLVRGRPAPSQLAAPPPTVATAPLDQLSVLLADDSADLRQLYRLLLTRRGVLVVAEAADGEEAVRLALQHRPDVALVDLAMPGLDGLQVTAELKQQLPGCAVVILSGFEESRVGTQARQAGADRYLSKGIDAAALVDALYALRPDRRRPTAAAAPA